MARYAFRHRQILRYRPVPIFLGRMNHAAGADHSHRHGPNLYPAPAINPLNVGAFGPWRRAPADWPPQRHANLLLVVMNFNRNRPKLRRIQLNMGRLQFMLN